MITALELSAITDFLLACWTLFLAGRLAEHIEVPRSTYAVITYFTFFLGVSALIGGIHHGFFEFHPQEQVLIRLTYWSIAIATFLIFWFTIEHFTSGTINKILKILALVQFVFFILTTYDSKNFSIVILNYFPVTLLFTVFNIFHLKKYRSAIYFCCFSGLVLLGSFMQVSKISLTQFYDHNFLYHLCLMIAYYFLFRGIKLLKPPS